MRLEFSSLKAQYYLIISLYCRLKDGWQRNLSFLFIFGHHVLSTFFFSFYLKVRESKPQRNMGRSCYHYAYNDKVYSIISLCCSCLFCGSIQISVGMSENKSYVVSQEVKLATKTRGHAGNCQLHLNMRRSGLQAKHKGEGRNKCSAGDQNKVQHPCTY